MRNADMPAMPVRGHDGEPINLRGDDAILWSGDAMGLSKREMVAMHCVAAAFGGAVMRGRGCHMGELVCNAVELADNLLAALEKTPIHHCEGDEA